MEPMVDPEDGEGAVLDEPNGIKELKKVERSSINKNKFNIKSWKILSML